eukprot:130625-Rhodomonas_salina.1
MGRPFQRIKKYGYEWRTQHKYPFTARRQCKARQLEGLRTLSESAGRARQPTCRNLTVRRTN